MDSVSNELLHMKKRCIRPVLIAIFWREPRRRSRRGATATATARVPSSTAMDDAVKASAPDEAVLLLHISGNTLTDAAMEDGFFTVFVDSSLNTHMAVCVSPRDTVADLKCKIRTEHHSCFPALGDIVIHAIKKSGFHAFGDIVIHAIKVQRRRILYHLSDSMFVKSAFDRKMRTWFLHMDISTLCTFKHQEEQRQVLFTPEIDVQMEIPESLEAFSCKQIDRTLKSLVVTGTDESKDAGETSKLCIISSDIGNLSKDCHLIEGFTNKSGNADDQLLLSQNADIVNGKFIVSEQTVQGNKEKVSNVSDAVGENLNSYQKASISAEERAVNFDKQQNCNTRMDLIVDSRLKEEVKFAGLKSEIVSSDAVPSKSRRRSRDKDKPIDGSTLEGLLVPVSGNKKTKQRKSKNGLLDLDNASFKEDAAVNAFHTAEKSEIEKLADLNPQEGEDANVDKSNCTPEDMKGESKSSSDLVKVKGKKKRVPKGQEADHDNSTDPHLLKRPDDMTNMGNANVISQEGESKLSASCGMDQNGLQTLPLVETYPDSEHSKKKKRKQPERTRDHVVVALETPSVNHHNDSPMDELPSVSEHKNIGNHGGTVDQINGTKSFEKINLYVETKKVDAGYTVSGAESLTSMKGVGIDVLTGKKMVRTEDVMAPKDSKRKSRKIESAVAERSIVPQVEAEGIAPNAFGSEHIEHIQERSIYSNEDGSTKKRKKSHKKVKNVDSEISAPASQQLSPSTMKEKCEKNKQGPSNMQSEEKGINPNMESIHGGAVEGDVDHDDGCSNNGDIVDQINGTKSSEQRILYAETKQVDAGYTLSGNKSLQSMKGIGINAVPEKEITRVEDGMVSKDGKRKKSKMTESAVPERCIFPQLEADRIASNAVGPDHVEPMDGRNTDNKKGGSTEKVKESRKKLKNMGSEISMPDSPLLSPSIIKEKIEQNMHGSPKMQLSESGALPSLSSEEKMGSIHEGVVEGDVDQDDGCSKNGDIAEQINGTRSSVQRNVYGENKQVDAGYTLSGNESRSIKGRDIDAVPEKGIGQAENGIVSKDSKKKKSKKTESAVAGKRIVPQVEADRVAPNAVSPEHTRPIDERRSQSKKGGSTEKGKKSRKNVKNVDSEISMPDSQLLSPSNLREKCEQNNEGSSKMQLINCGALTSQPSDKKSTKRNVEFIHEVTAEGDADFDDGCSSSSDRVKENEIHHPQKDSLNFIDYFVPRSNTDNKQVHVESAAPGKKTKKARAVQNSSAPPSEADVSGKVRKGQAHQASERTSDTRPRADVQQPSRAGPDHSFAKTSDQELPSRGASNHVRSSKGGDSEGESDATTDASLNNLSASSYSDQNLDSSGSETLSSDAGSDAHGDGYLVTPAARSNVGSIGRKMVQTRSVTAARLTEIFKSSSTCRNAVLQASKSKHGQSKVDDTDSPPVDTVAETQDNQAVMRLG